MQSETGFPSSHQLKSYVASKSRRKLAARAVLSADAGLLVKTHLSSVHSLLCSKKTKYSSKPNANYVILLDDAKVEHATEF